MGAAVTRRIEQWSVVPCERDAFRAPEQRDHHHLQGLVDDKPRYTSRIVSSFRREVTTGSGSVYVLGEPAAEYLEWLAAQGLVLDEEQPVKVGLRG